MQFSRRKIKSEAPAERQEKADKNMEKAFELPEDSASLRIFRRNDKGQLKILDVLSRSAVPNSDELISVVQDRWGGGRYYILPTVGGKKAGEGFPLEFDGPVKPSKKNQRSSDSNDSGKTGRNKELDEVKEQLRELQEKEREDRLFERLRDEVKAAIPKSDGTREAFNSMLANLPQIVTAASSLMGTKESASDMLEKISSIWRNIETSMPKLPDPVAQAREMASLIFEVVNQSRPPAVATGTGASSFWSAFLAELAQKFTAGMPAQAGGFAGIAGQPQQPALSTSPVAQGQPPGGGFSGLQQGQPAQQPQQPAVNLDTLSRSMAIQNPINVIREMIRDREDVDRIAEFTVYLLDFVGTFAEPGADWMPYIRGFLSQPEAGFDKAVAFIPELQQLQAQDSEYLSRLKAAVVKAARSYAVEMERQRQRAEPAGQEPPAVDEEPEPQHQAEPEQSSAGDDGEAGEVKLSLDKDKSL